MKLFIALTSLLALAVPASADLYANDVSTAEYCIAGLVETSPGVYTIDWVDQYGLSTIEGVTDDALDYIRSVELDTGRSLSC